MSLPAVPDRGKQSVILAALEKGATRRAHLCQKGAGPLAFRRGTGPVPVVLLK